MCRLSSLAAIAAVPWRVACDAPPNVVRTANALDWCDCGSGLQSVTLWPSSNKSAAQTLQPEDAPTFVQFGQPVGELSWSCDGMRGESKTSLDPPAAVWAVQLSAQGKKVCLPPGKSSGRLSFTSWSPATYLTSVPYMSGEAGYFCIKIPVLLRTANRTLLAFAEARRDSCSDFTFTDLVLRRSHDDGITWSPLQVVRSESGPGLPATVIGNAAPVQLRDGPGAKHAGRILVPHTRNNSDTWLTYSDDDGATWAESRPIPEADVEGWAWTATGPPGALQLSGGRILVPSYHGRTRANLVNNLVHGHVLLSDDEGETWRLPAQHEHWGGGGHYSNENQAVELQNGSILVNARSFATLTTPSRIQALSNDGGETFGSVRNVPELPQPFNGCQGSILAAPDGALYFSGPDSKVARTGMTIWSSADAGDTWQKVAQLDAGMSGYSSLQWLGDDKLGLLYEQSDELQLVMNPFRFIYREVAVSEISLTPSVV